MHQCEQNLYQFMESMKAYFFKFTKFTQFADCYNLRVTHGFLLQTNAITFLQFNRRDRLTLENRMYY